MTEDIHNDSLADLVRAAIDDARKLDRRIYIPDSDYWHQPSRTEDRENVPDGKCFICLAGARIAGGMGIAPGKEYFPVTDADDDDYDRLRALDSARTGQWAEAYYHLSQPGREGAIRDALVNIPKPVDAHFWQWEEFDRHLESLEQIAGTLEAFEAACQPGY